MLRSEVCFLGKHSARTNDFVLHSHNCHEVVYFLKGKGHMFIGGNTCAVYPHKYCIVPPNTEHMEQLEDDGEILFIGFNLKSGSCAGIDGLYDRGNTHALDRLETILHEFKHQRVGYQEAANALLQLFLVEHLRQHTRESKECKDLHYVKTYLEQYYSQKINFRELSALTGYSYDYFRHMFRRTYGVSPQEYLIDVRLEQAKELLQSTTLSCTQIAAACGFSNGGQMSAMIKRKFESAPSVLRKTDSYKNIYD